MEKEFTIKVKMQERWIPYFLGLLKTMQKLGVWGSSRTVSFMADGDGDFRPTFEWDVESEIKDLNEEEIDQGKIIDAG